MQEDFPEVSVTGIQSFISLQQLTIMVFTLLSGVLTAFFSKKILLVMGLLFVAAFGTLPVILNDYYCILLTRLGFGAGQTDRRYLEQDTAGPCAVFADDDKVVLTFTYHDPQRARRRITARRSPVPLRPKENPSNISLKLKYSIKTLNFFNFSLDYI